MSGINIFKSSPDAVEVQPGDVLFREGEIGDVMFAVVDGEVELTRGDRVVEAVGAGGILGEMALIDTERRSATATARTPSRIVRVDQRHFTFLVHEHPTFALQVMKVMAERLRRGEQHLGALTASVRLAEQSGGVLAATRSSVRARSATTPSAPASHR